jgi:hypothetical protein
MPKTLGVILQENLLGSTKDRLSALLPFSTIVTQHILNQDLVAIWRDLFEPI